MRAQRDWRHLKPGAGDPPRRSPDRGTGRGGEGDTTGGTADDGGTGALPLGDAALLRFAVDPLTGVVGVSLLKA